MQEFDLNAGQVPNLGDVPRKMMRKGMKRIATAVSGRIRALIPVRTGKLAGSARQRVAGDGRAATILVGRSGRGQPWYANFADRGTKAHRIPGEFRTIRFASGGRVREVRKGYYAFLHGHFVFVHAYTHRGAGAAHFLERGGAGSVAEVEQILGAVAEQALGEL